MTDTMAAATSEGLRHAEGSSPGAMASRSAVKVLIGATQYLPQKRELM
jgi:hypothetical protein